MESINKQKKYLSENLIVESLRMYESNKEEVKEFLQAKCGNVIEEYLRNEAWNDDYDNNTRVFLVRDAYSARTAHPLRRNGAPFRFKLSKAQLVD